MNPPSDHRWHRFLPNALSFTASFCIMTIELTAGRMIAKFVGSSLYTWTSVIGVVLGGITVGNYVGGILADRYPPRKILPLLFLLGGAGAALTPFLNEMLGDLSWYGSRFGLDSVSWSTRIFMHVTLVFLVPSTLLGLIGPVVAKMALDLGNAPGRTIGDVYAFGAFGSIMGTFMTGFFFLSWLGTFSLCLTVAGVLVAVGYALAPQNWRPSGFMIMLCVVLFGRQWQSAFAQVLRPPEKGIIFQDESDYSFITINESSDGVSNFRQLTLDYLAHSYVDIDNPYNLLYDYENTYKAIMTRAAGDKDHISTLFIGGGGFVFPQYIRMLYPGSMIQVAEIDPAVTEAVRDHFNMPAGVLQVVESPDDILTDPAILRSGPIWVRNIDARNHIEDLVRRKERGDDVAFDFVFGDAYNDLSPPFHLTTKEFNDKIATILKPDGIYMFNIIDTFNSAQFLGSVISTMRKTFPHIAVFSNTEGGPSRAPDARDTFIVAGSREPMDLDNLPGESYYETFEGSRLSEMEIAEAERKAGKLVLTDNYAPVEQLTAPMVRMRSS